MRTGDLTALTYAMRFCIRVSLAICFLIVPCVAVSIREVWIGKNGMFLQCGRRSAAAIVSR